MIITVLIPMLSQFGESLLDAALDDVLQVNHAQRLGAFRDDERRAALSSNLSTDSRIRRGYLPPCSPTNRSMLGAAPLRICRPLMSTPLSRVCAENGMNVAPSS